MILVVARPTANAASVRLCHAYIATYIVQVEAAVPATEIEDAAFVNVVGDALEPLNQVNGKGEPMRCKNMV